MQSGGKCLIDAQTARVKYGDAPSVTSDGSKAGSSYNSVPWTLDPNSEKKQEILAQHQAFFDGFKNC
jgi:hypothetical protein